MADNIDTLKDTIKRYQETHKALKSADGFHVREGILKFGLSWDDSEDAKGRAYFVCKARDEVVEAMMPAILERAANMVKRELNDAGIEVDEDDQM